MVKGISRQVIVVHSPDPKLFEQAIFILKEDAAQNGVRRGADERSGAGDPPGGTAPQKAKTILLRCLLGCNRRFGYRTDLAGNLPAIMKLKERKPCKLEQFR